MGKALGGGGGQTQVARRLTGRLPRRTLYGRWRYISVTATREEALFLTMEEYISRWHNTVGQYISTRSLLDLCEGSERSLGAKVGMRWWEQVGIDLTGARGAAEAKAEGDGWEELRREVKEDSRVGAKVRVQRSNIWLIKGQSMVSLWPLYRV